MELDLEWRCEAEAPLAARPFAVVGREVSETEEAAIRRGDSDISENINQPEGVGGSGQREQKRAVHSFSAPFSILTNAIRARPAEAKSDTVGRASEVVSRKSAICS